MKIISYVQILEHFLFKNVLDESLKVKKYVLNEN